MQKNRFLNQYKQLACKDNWRIFSLESFQSGIKRFYKNWCHYSEIMLTFKLSLLFSILALQPRQSLPKSTKAFDHDVDENGRCHEDLKRRLKSDPSNNAASLCETWRRTRSWFSVQRSKFIRVYAAAAYFCSAAYIRKDLGRWVGKTASNQQKNFSK